MEILLSSGIPQRLLAITTHIFRQFPNHRSSFFVRKGSKGLATWRLLLFREHISSLTRDIWRLVITNGRTLVITFVINRSLLIEKTTVARDGLLVMYVSMLGRKETEICLFKNVTLPEFNNKRTINEESPLFQVVSYLPNRLVPSANFVWFRVLGMFVRFVDKRGKRKLLVSFAG